MFRKAEELVDTTISCMYHSYEIVYDFYKALESSARMLEQVVINEVRQRCSRVFWAGKLFVHANDTDIAHIEFQRVKVKYISA